MDGLSLYLVGPIRGLRFEEADDWRERWTTILEAMGYRVASPMRGKENLKGRGPIVNSYEEIPMSSARGIYGRDTFDVVMCEVTVANLLGATEASIGSAMEIQRGHDFNRYVLVVMDESGVHNHPFIKEAASLVVHSEEEAFEVLENLIKPYRTRLTLASEGADG